MSSLYPFVLYVRSYAPFESFGMGFHGDGRGPSTRDEASSRIWLSVGFDPISGSVGSGRAGTSGTRHALSSRVWRVAPGVSVRSWLTGAAMHLELHLAGANPALDPVSPEIDVHLKLRLHAHARTVSVYAQLTGDAFPNAEVFILNSRTNRRTMIVTFETTRGPNSGPGLALWGDSRRQMNAICKYISL